MVLYFVGTNTINAMKLISESQPEKKLFGLISQSQGTFAIPRTLIYPSVEYIYTKNTHLTLSQTDIFRRNLNKLMFYDSDDDLEEVVLKVEYIVVVKQMLQSLSSEANLMRIEPYYTSLDILGDDVLKDTLDKYGFDKVYSWKVSAYETMSKYDPASLGLKIIDVYHRIN